jgi:periplasmic protein TonB
MTDVVQLIESRRWRFSRWAAAAIIVCALHAAGAALALMHWEEETSDDPAGGLTVELAPLPAAMPVDSPDVAHGPDQQAAKMTPEASKQVVEKVEKDIPLVEPSRVRDPEVTLPKPQPDEKEQPKEEEAKEAVSEKERPAQDEEHEFATAPPRVEAQPAPSSAPSPGKSPDLARAQAAWQKVVVRQLERYRHYPDAADRRGIRGNLVVRFRLDESGQVIASEITESSGSPILDKEALDLLKRASPFPAPPPGVELDFALPIDFKIR